MGEEQMWRECVQATVRRSGLTGSGFGAEHV